jgi:hypothetical protein
MPWGVKVQLGPQSLPVFLVMKRSIIGRMRCVRTNTAVPVLAAGTCSTSHGGSGSSGLCTAVGGDGEGQGHPASVSCWCQRTPRRERLQAQHLLSQAVAAGQGCAGFGVPLPAWWVACLAGC